MYEKRHREEPIGQRRRGEQQAELLDKTLVKGEQKRLSGFLNGTFRMAPDHGEFTFRSAHQPMQICRLGRDACGKATGCEPPTVVEALGIGLDDKREEAFPQSG